MSSSIMPRIAVGIGTAIDSYLILEIKKEKFASNPEKLDAVRKEIEEYQPIIDAVIAQHPSITELMTTLRSVHLLLWDIENRKREIENNDSTQALVERLTQIEHREVLEEYLTLSRHVSAYNDQRASIKKQMNIMTGSVIQEIKSHSTV